MPVLHLKNKITRSLITTAEQAIAVGAIPSHFTLDASEAFQLLKEVRELENIAVHFRFKQDDEKLDVGEPNIVFLLKQSDVETSKTILRRWHQGIYTVSYVHVMAKPQQPEAQTLTKRESTDLLIPLTIIQKSKGPKEEKDSSQT
jgi:hypothetical protein